MKIDENLSELFDIEPTEEPKGEVQIIDKDGSVIDKDSTKIEDDYDLARENLQRLLVIGTDALENALSVAKQSDHPRAYEVVGSLVKQLADVNQQLMDVHQQKKKLDETGKETNKPASVSNNSIFVGSTAELTKMIKELKQG